MNLLSIFLLAGSLLVTDETGKPVNEATLLLVGPDSMQIVAYHAQLDSNEIKFESPVSTVKGIIYAPGYVPQNVDIGPGVVKLQVRLKSLNTPDQLSIEGNMIQVLTNEPNVSLEESLDLVHWRKVITWPFAGVHLFKVLHNGFWRYSIAPETQ